MIEGLELIEIDPRLVRTVVDRILSKARQTTGLPISVAIVDVWGRIIDHHNMARVLPISRTLSIAKARTSILMQMNASFMKENWDPSDFVDPEFTRIRGGIFVQGDKKAYAGIGVSGRDSSYRKKKSQRTKFQDEELSIYGGEFLLGEIKKTEASI